MQGIHSYYKAALALNVMVLVFLSYRELTRRECTKIYTTNSTTNKIEVMRKEVVEEKKRPVLGFLSHKADQKRRLKALVQRKAPALDEELLAYVKEVMDIPAPRNQIKMSRTLYQTPQAAEIDRILRQKRNGFFIEAGGLDGERSSNTIWFEKSRGWTGLLVEPDPYFYTQLLGKNRASWSINACISPLTHVSELPFSMSLGGLGTLKMKEKLSNHFKVPCYPLQTLLAALSVTHVDFFSLDVEGAEGIVLESIPFDKLDISTLAVEYAHGNKKKYTDLMQGRGYNMTKDLVVHKPELTLWVDDFIFVKNNFK